VKVPPQVAPRAAAFEVKVEPLGVGTDLCEVSRMERELSRDGGGFRDAVFTPAEVAYCSAKSHPAQHFAARFAAKEAVFKALAATGATAPPWREVEIVTGERGEPHVALHGIAAELARSGGIDTVIVTLTHTRDLAMAFAVAVASRRHGRGRRR
jgi:holo-[acyl-carrier protein] synthase